jgi:RNA polymerase sigma-70 factor (ECF subfamily)
VIGGLQMAQTRVTIKDIADKEDVSINTALGRMRYALINMRKLIEKHNLVTHI